MILGSADMFACHVAYYGFDGAGVREEEVLPRRPEQIVLRTIREDLDDTVMPCSILWRRMEGFSIIVLMEMLAFSAGSSSHCGSCL